MSFSDASRTPEFESSEVKSFEWQTAGKGALMCEGRETQSPGDRISHVEVETP